MNKQIKCVCDNDLPEDFQEAGKAGLLQVSSDIGWIDIPSDDFDGGRNGCEYRIKELS